MVTHPSTTLTQSHVSDFYNKASPRGGGLCALEGARAAHATRRRASVCATRARTGAHVCVRRHLAPT